MMIKPGKYRHYKGRLYLVVGIVKHSETLEVMVLYISLYDNDTSQMWVRPAAMFEEEVEVDGKKVPRFKYLGE
jgi:hypothetical protein